MTEVESPLQLPGDIYAPFTHDEVKRLRHFVADVEGLRQSPLFAEQKNVVHLSAEMGGPLKQELDYNGEDAIHAVVGRFRQRYNRHEPSSYNAILKLLDRHVHERESPLQREAHDALKEGAGAAGSAVAEFPEPSARRDGAYARLAGWAAAWR
jgi:hypothetical protein